MGVISRMTLGELLLELDETGVATDFRCAICCTAPQLEIMDLHPLGYKLQCARCQEMMWSGERETLNWNVKGFDGVEEIYDAEEIMDPDTMQGHLQDLVQQHLAPAERRRPELFEVKWNRGAPRLSYICGTNPHYVAITIEPTDHD